MKVKPNESYKLLGTSLSLVKGRVYKAIIATNQPDYKEKGLIFVRGILLGNGEYEIVQPKEVKKKHEQGFVYYHVRCRCKSPKCKTLSEYIRDERNGKVFLVNKNGKEKKINFPSARLFEDLEYGMLDYSDRPYEFGHLTKEVS